MANFANISANLNLNIQNFSRNLHLASTQMRSFSNSMTGQVTPALSAANRSTTAWGLNLKSVSRVVSGIVIAQSFYKILQEVQAATGAVWEFTKQLEYAQIAYSNLFGSTSIAQEFINVLRDYTATTPFNFKEAESSARRLLAYGIEYENIMFVMQGILSTASAQGDSSRIEQISRAIGQIYTYGKLMTAEVRQLTEAGVPAYEILQEELGLTQEQLRNLGREAIPASDAINALIVGMRKRFDGVVVASSRTITGLLNNISDNATMLFSNMFEPLTRIIKSALAELADFLMYLREISEVSGTGGVFEALVPYELQGTLRVLIANILTFAQSIIRAGMAIGTALQPALYGAVELFNKLLPIIIGLINALSSLIVYILSNETVLKSIAATLAAAAAMWVVFRVQALASAAIAGVVNVIAAALAGLGRMLTFLVAHPFWAMIIGFSGLAVGLSGGFDSLGSKIDGFFKKLTSFNGIDPNKILLPSQKERANDLDKFNKALDGTSDAMDELGDSTQGAAAKAKSGLLSFDEVFKLKDPDEGNGAGSYDTSGLEELLKELASGGGTYMPEVIDFGQYTDQIVDGFTDSLKTSFGNLKEKLIGAGIGTIIGAALGFVLGGGPIGAKVGAAAGAIAGWFWDSLGEELTKTDFGKVAVPIAGGIGAVIGGIAGGPLGAMLGLGIGSLVGFISDEIAAGIESDDFDWANIGMGLGSMLGGAIGLVAGGPGGAAIGVAVGALIGWIGGLIADNWTSITTWFDDTSTEISNWFNGIWLEYELWCTKVREKLDELLRDIGVWFNTLWQDYELWSTKVREKLDELLRNIGEWFNGVWLEYELWCTKVKEKLSTWFTELWNKIATWFNNTISSIDTWFNNLWLDYELWCANVKEKLNRWFSELWNKISTWFGNLITNVKTWWSNLWSVDKWETGWDRVKSWFAALLLKIIGWFSDRKTDIKTKWSDLWSTSNWTSGWDKVSGWFSDLRSSISNWFTNIGSAISSWWDGLWDGKSANVNVSGGVSGGVSIGHATGGIFDREHVARFAEGNKAEAIIPLENNTAMQPFVDAVSRGVISTLAPVLVQGNGNSSNLPPMYVGTLVADDRGLKELYRKFELIQVQENARRGFT